MTKQKDNMKYDNPLNQVSDIRTGHRICANCLECIECGMCHCNKSKFDLAHIEHALRTMTVNTKLYKMIKEELKRRGHWKNAPRGFQVAGKKNPNNFKEKKNVL